MHRALQSATGPVLAVLGGLALWLAFPDHNLWWLAPVGVALIGAATLRAGFRGGLVLGLFAGWAFFIPVLSWSGVYVGAVPWIALATLQALYVALMGGLVGWAGRRLADRGAQLAAFALIPLGWVAQELARGTTPWGGFPWARLAFSQADSPLLPIAAWCGAPGVTAAVAVIGTLLLVSVRALAQPARVPRLTAALLGAGLVGALAAVIPLSTDGRTVTVGFVQGNVPHPGLDFNAERRAVLDNHVNGTLELASDGLDDATLVVWPENSSDIDPFRNPDAQAQIDRAVEAAGVPVLVGAVLAEPVDHNSNVSLLYRPGEQTPERYTKLHPVPFAEYIPYRSFFAWFDESANLAGNFVAGSQIGAFDIPAPGGSYWALPTICFEVAYDGLMRDAVLLKGAEDSLLVVQTNNATFGYTAESEQQFAISRVRAVEHGRSVVHVSTVGVSGLINPDGSVRAKTSLFTAEHELVAPVIRSELTVSDRMGPWPEWAAVAAFLLLVGLSARRSSRPTDPINVSTTKAPTSKDHAVA
ncbi:MAG: apolipoprotein N-acyltransferase [Phycicoccus sp.]|nr:apolipoprotein N-acyltransferase [Phycicoccus sp.]